MQPRYTRSSVGRKKSKSKVVKSKSTLPIVWDKQCDSAFSGLKERLTSVPVLGYPDMTLSFILEIDASFSGHGAVVLGYASRGLRGSEKHMSNYSSMKLELLGLKWALAKQFRDVLKVR